MTTKLPRAIACACITSCATLLACSPTPLRTVTQYADAVEQSLPEKAWQLLSEDFKNANSYDDFKVVFDAGDDLPDKIRQLNEFNVNADFNGQFSMSYTNGQWKMDSPNFDFYRTDTPGNTLKTFICAAKLERFDILLTLIPNALAENLSAESLRNDWHKRAPDYQERIALLQQHIDNTITVKNQTAWMDYANYRIIFIIEDNSWKIISL